MIEIKQEPIETQNLSSSNILNKKKVEITNFVAEIIKEYPIVSPIGEEDPININIAANMLLLKKAQQALDVALETQNQARNNEIAQFALELKTYQENLQKSFDYSVVLLEEKIKNFANIYTEESIKKIKSSTEDFINENIKETKKTAKEVIADILGENKNELLDKINSKTQQELDLVRKKIEDLIQIANENSLNILKQAQKNAKNGFIAANIGLLASGLNIALILFFVLAFIQGV